MYFCSFFVQNDKNEKKISFKKPNSPNGDPNWQKGPYRAKGVHSFLLRDGCDIAVTQTCQTYFRVNLSTIFVSF